jgi:phosphatidylglycerophosphatase B
VPALTDRNRLALVLGAILIAVLFSPWLPDLALNTGPADIVVVVTDTAAWPQLGLLGIAVVVAVISREGIKNRRRRGEASAFGLVLLVFLAGNAALNEYAVKPTVGIPRPNIEALAEGGVLGPGLPDAEAFYAIGNKAARREVLGEQLTPQTTPDLSDRVRTHWIHETGYSFPSGHSTAAGTLSAILAATGVAWLGGWRRNLALMVVPMWAVAVAYSRVLLDVHTAADVIVGMAAGLLWGALAFFVARRLAARFETETRGGEATRV